MNEKKKHDRNIYTNSHIQRNERASEHMRSECMKDIWKTKEEDRKFKGRIMDRFESYGIYGLRAQIQCKPPNHRVDSTQMNKIEHSKNKNKWNYVLFKNNKTSSRDEKKRRYGHKMRKNEKMCIGDHITNELPIEMCACIIVFDMHERRTCGLVFVCIVRNDAIKIRLKFHTPKSTHWYQWCSNKHTNTPFKW